MLNWRSISISTTLSWLMKLLMVGQAPYVIYTGDYLFAFAIFMAVLISLVPSIVERSYHITLPTELDLLITAMIFLHTFLGEGLKFYEKFWLWDKILHFYGSAVIAILAFVAVYTLHYTRKIRLTLPLMWFFTVTFTLAIGGIWEIGEFMVDKLFAKNTQKGLDNTMIDLINDFTGGLVTAGLGMMYLKYVKPEARKRLEKPLGDIFRPRTQREPRSRQRG